MIEDRMKLPIQYLVVQIVLHISKQYIEYMWFKCGWCDFTKPGYFSESGAGE